MSVFLEETSLTYLETAKKAFTYIESKKVQTEYGIYWSLDESTDNGAYFDETSIYAGSAGILYFYLQLSKVTNDNRYLKDAKEALRYIQHRWETDRDLQLAISNWAYTSGYSGIGYVLTELYLHTKDTSYSDFVTAIGQEIINQAVKDEAGNGYYWSGAIGVIADSGTLLFLLDTAEKLSIPEWTTFAIEAGRYLLNKGITYPDGGIYYKGVQFGPEGSHFPGFPLGSAGVGYTLLKLYKASGDDQFLAATDGIKEYYEAIAQGDEEALLIPHNVPNDHIYYLGYCGGPAGIVRYFYYYYTLTKNEEYRDFYQKLLKGVLKTGAPDIHSEGYWHTHTQCCGTSGLVDTFIGAYLDTKDPLYLAAAKRSGLQLLGWSRDEPTDSEIIGTKWYQAYSRIDPDQITTAIGYYDGAAGIASSLLHLYQIEEHAFPIQNVLDNPFPVQ